MNMRKAAVIGIVLLCAVVLLSAQKTGPKIYVSVDMEGIWGVVHSDQVNSTTSDYGPARRWMAEDVNAVIKGLWAAGAGAVVVNDGHGGMRNIVADALDDLNPRYPEPPAGIEGTKVV